MNYALGIDIGGSDIKAVALTPRDGKIALTRRFPRGNDLKRDWPAKVAAALGAVQKELGSPPAWFGLASPGIPSEDESAVAWMRGRMEMIRGLDWKSELGWASGLRVINGAHAALMGELWKGAFRGRRSGVLITIATGVGGAILLNGKLLRGNVGRAGHLGHMSINQFGAPGTVGTPGTLEMAIGELTVKERTHGRHSTTRDLVNAYLAGDEESARAWLRSVQALGVAIASLVNVLDPEVVVLGGAAVEEAGDALFAPLRKVLDEVEWRPFGGTGVPVVASELGENAGAIGAARYAIDEVMEDEV